MSSTRDRIVESADDLFYRQGFEHTSFSDVAAAVNISRGNFYHHFKSKDDILTAVIERRLAHTRGMLQQWESEAQTPEARIGCFIEILIRNRAKITLYGCPVGTLSAELAKLAHPSLAGANELFNLFRDWLARQFILLGRTDDADALAMHVLARSQGVATLAAAFNDERFIRHEVSLLRDWLRQQVAQPPQADRLRTAGALPGQS
jgi:AcrR family transcriptional regulator